MPSSSRIDPLLEPVKIRGVELPNRVIMSPMTRGASPNGVPSPDVAAYYRRRAEGGVGTIFTESIFIDDKGTLGKFDLEGGDDKQIGWPIMFTDAALEGWRLVVDEVHAAGGLIFPQLMHLGIQRTPAKGQAWSDIHISSPSGIWGTPEQIAELDEERARVLNCPEKAMTEDEIVAVIDAFASAAANARSVGFDGIALHGGHGYLIDNFMRSETNIRNDKWGGDHKQRMRFAVEIVSAVRKAIGDEMPISFRFSQWTHHDVDAMLTKTPQELQDILQMLAAAGVDIFEASARDFRDPVYEGSDLNISGWTRKLIDRPVAMVGGTGVRRERHESALKPPQVVDNVDEIMERYVHGEFDLLAIGRALLNDPNWLQRARKGEPFLAFNPDCLKMGYVQ
jgi:2,4-dienoyl-CoA reductase-like NADH-dependent reductase (Old Yellow Enzyme family)